MLTVYIVMTRILQVSDDYDRDSDSWHSKYKAFIPWLRNTRMSMTLIVQAKEIECQKCRKFHVTAYETRWVKECYPVFDEHCSTKYDKERRQHHL